MIVQLLAWSALGGALAEGFEQVPDLVERLVRAKQAEQTGPQGAGERESG